MAPKRARSNLPGRGNRFGDFSDLNRKVIVRTDAGRKRLIKKFQQAGMEVRWSCYRREVEEFDRERVCRGIPESSKVADVRLEREMKVRRETESESATVVRLDMLQRTLDLLQPDALDLFDSIPVEMVGCVLSLVLLRKEKKTEHRRDED